MFSFVILVANMKIKQKHFINCTKWCTHFVQLIKGTPNRQNAKRFTPL